MDIGTVPMKKLYLTPLAVLAIGGLIFYYLLMQNISSLNHLVTEIIPGESITIEARKDEEFYILLDTISRDYLMVTPLTDTTEVRYLDRVQSYDIEFSIYEENNPTNTVVATDLLGTTRIVMFEHEVFMNVTFEKAGTYVIETSIEQDNTHNFTFGVAKVSPVDFLFQIIITGLVLIVSLVIPIIIFVKIHSKRAKALYEIKNSPYYSQDYY